MLHSFRYRLFMPFLNLESLESDPGSKSVKGFLRSDHFGSLQMSLYGSVKGLVSEAMGFRPTGPVFMLAHLRRLGYVFNPVTFYFCMSQTGERIEAVVSEIHNTPWKERHCIVVPGSDRGAEKDFKKEFHVSPFFSMDQDYVWRFSRPSKRLAVHMENFENGEKVFDATLVMKRREWSTETKKALFLKYPAMTHQVTSAIYAEAAKLWVKGCPYHAHPKEAVAESGRVS